MNAERKGPVHRVPDPFGLLVRTVLQWRMPQLSIYTGIGLIWVALVVGCSGSSTSGDDSPPPANVSTCSTGALFTTPPVTLSNLEGALGIVPLGNLNPPDHTFPTAHLYFYIKDSDSGVAGVDSVPLYAPGDLVITNIASSTQESTGKTDYSLTFYPCSQARGYFGHVATLAGDVSTAFSASTASCTTYNPGSGNYTRCEQSVNVTVAAGVQIGTAGGPTTASYALDFGLYDARVTALAFANAARIAASANTFDLFHIVCAIDYYTESVKADLESKLNRTAGALPLCGSYNQDVAATAQGKWFEASAASPYTTESGNLALVHSNSQPELGEFSIGNSSIGVGTATFTPTHSGTTNRDFGEVTADENLYCYDTLSTAGVIFLIQLPTATSLKIEKQSVASCPAAPAFTDSALTFVR